MSTVLYTLVDECAISVLNWYFPQVFPENKRWGFKITKREKNTLTVKWFTRREKQIVQCVFFFNACLPFLLLYVLAYLEEHIVTGHQINRLLHHQALLQENLKEPDLSGH